jgi:hypothetical protein
MKSANLPNNSSFTHQWDPKNGVLKLLHNPNYFGLKKLKIFFTETPHLLGVKCIYIKIITSNN